MNGSGSGAVLHPCRQHALARAHWWKRTPDDGRYGSVSELAAAEKVDRGYLGRILMLTLLAPDIVEAIMDGQQPAGLDVNVLREGFPMEWGGAERHFGELAPRQKILSTIAALRPLPPSDVRGLARDWG